ncbi:MAG: dTMP kinase [candidate division Zixibacteria bacterium]|nr:dTMP kinase [candidate division Zixibacteria bacterium]
MGDNEYKEIPGGLFISFEGIDYCGKSTQVKLLSSKLSHDGYGIVVVREPGGTEISEQIRAVLLDNANIKMAPEAELLLYEASRAQLTRQLIIPGKDAGKVVLCDRYFDSTTAYQGYGRGLDLDSINKMNLLASCGIKPDMTFLFDLPAEAAQARFSSVPLFKDRLEEEKIDFHRRVRNGYLKIAELERERFKVIDAEDDIDNIAEKIFTEVKKRF